MFIDDNRVAQYGIMVTKGPQSLLPLVSIQETRGQTRQSGPCPSQTRAASWVMLHSYQYQMDGVPHGVGWGVGWQVGLQARLARSD